MPSRSPVALYTALLAQQGLMQREKLLREWNVAKCANAHGREALLHSHRATAVRLSADSKLSCRQLCSVGQRSGSAACGHL